MSLRSSSSVSPTRSSPDSTAIVARDRAAGAHVVLGPQRDLEVVGGREPVGDERRFERDHSPALVQGPSDFIG